MRSFAREILDSVPYPTFGIATDQRVLWANAAARRYFGMSEAQMRQVESKGLGAFDREFRRRHVRAWIERGQRYPALYHFEGATGRSEFLLIPFPIPAVARAALAVVLIPSAMLGAAIAGRPARAASQARKWLEALAAEAEALRNAEALRALAERRGGDPAFASLTPREWEIARRIASGDRVSFLAEELRISPNTVRNHLKAIFRKLRVSSQPQLVRSIRAFASRPAASA